MDALVVMMSLVLLSLFPLGGSEGKFCLTSPRGGGPHNRTGLALQPPLVIVSGVSWQSDLEKLMANRKTGKTFVAGK